jgi:tetratricopeptide (TPR) repeat protein
VLNTLGDPVDEVTLAAEIPTLRGGVLSLDLVLAARRRGFEADLATGDAEAIRRELRAGRAAVLMLRLLDAPGRSRDIYHYVVVDGLDAERGLFRFQFGDGKWRWAGLPEVEGSWKAAGRALIRVSPKAPSLADGLARGVALEQAGRAEEAAAHYRLLLSDHPASVRLLVNLGNAEAARGRNVDAEAAYRSALEQDPADRDALNNLAWLLLGDPDRLGDAEVLAARAAEAPGPERPAVLHTLGRIRLARGRCGQAADAFHTALAGEAAPALRAKLEAGLAEARACAGSGRPGPTPGRPR